MDLYLYFQLVLWDDLPDPKGPLSPPILQQIYQTSPLNFFFDFGTWLEIMCWALGRDLPVSASIGELAIRTGP